MAILNTFLDSIPQASRYLTLALLSISTLLFVLRSGLTREDLKQLSYGGQDSILAFPSVVILPGAVLWRPWTLLTAAFVEINLIELILTAVSLLLAGRYLERVWGSNEYLKFVAFSIISSNAIATGVNIIEHYVLNNSGFFLYGQSYHGMMALQTAFLVAFTQLIPEHQVQILGGLLKLKVKSLPMLYVTFSNIMCLIGYQSPFILIQFGWLTSYVYLRLIKDGGDKSDTFAFSNWFPPFLQKYVAFGANQAYLIAVKVKVLKPWSDLEQGYTAANPANARAEAERRRAMALQALDSRLAASKPSAATSTPLAKSSSQQSANGSTSGQNATAGTNESAVESVVFDASKESQ